jgi:CTP:molybdopterin cytidylyltransferase MocA
VLDSLGAELSLVDVDGPMPVDVDTPADLQALHGSRQR